MANKAFVVGACLALGGLGAAVLMVVLELGPAGDEKPSTPLELAGADATPSGTIASPATDEILRAVVEPPELSRESSSVRESMPHDAADMPAEAQVKERDDRTPEEKYSEKYAGATLDELIAAKGVLQVRRDLDRTRICDELIAADKLVDTESGQNPTPIRVRRARASGGRG